MSDLFPQPPIPPGGDPETTEYLHPSLDVREEQHWWTLQTARWRARELAEAIFGDDVPVSLDPWPRGSAVPLVFRGSLRLSVPFDGLARHRKRERLFTSCAADDPVLSKVPLLYMFDPDPCRITVGACSR